MVGSWKDFKEQEELQFDFKVNEYEDPEFNGGY